VRITRPRAPLPRPFRREGGAGPGSAERPASLAIAANRARPPVGAEAAPLSIADAERLRWYRTFQEFYEGKHFAQARRGRTSLVLNYARVIVDKGVSYLLGDGVGFAVPPVSESDAAARERARRAETLLYQVYWDNDLDAVDLQGALNGAILGDTVFKVFWDAARGRIRVVNLDPATFFPSWAGDDLGELRAVELRYALEASEAERLYGVAGRGLLRVVERWTPDELTVLVDGHEVRRGPNPYQELPFVHIANLRPANSFWGVSDLRDVIPLNRELNERVSDQADLIRYHADPPVIFKGVDEHSDLAVGPGTVWDIPADADVKLLEWSGQPPAVQGHIELVLRALYEIAETPRTAFGDSGRLLSGVALETELRPLLQKTLRKRVYWTAGLRRRNALVLRLAERFGLAEPGSLAPYQSRIVWPPMLPQDHAREVQEAIALVNAGLRSARTAMNELGVEHPEEELARVVADRALLGASRLPRPGSPIEMAGWERAGLGTEP